ncbi:LysR family transcriptional regulator [Oscillospiraceae bacterium PP1C4]
MARRQAMNIEYLKMFLCVVQQGSISKVAEHMHISQSALSQQIKTMEQLLGATLLIRSPKGVFPTKAGEIVYEYAQIIEGSYEQMLHEIAGTQNQNKTLHILSTPIVYSYALPCTLYHVKTNYPAYTLKMETLASAALEDKIAQGYGDIGFIVGKPENKALISKKVFSDTIYLVAGQDIEIPDKISFDQLYKYPLLMLSKTQKTRKILDEYLHKIGIDLNRLQILYDLDSTESIKLSAVRGFGLAFMPYMAIKKELYNKQLRIVEIDGFDLENHYYAIRKPQSEHTEPELLKLISFIEKILKDTVC